jgi:Sigma-70, region 4
MVGRTIRGPASPPEGGGLPDAQRPLGGGRRRAGVLAPSQPLRHERRREPGWMADNSGRAGMPRYAALALLAPRGALEADGPEPLTSQQDGLDPEHEVLLTDAVGLALLVVLDTLNPAERLAFVLHDLFGVPFDEIAKIVERTPTAARQLASRARRRVQGATNVQDVDLTRSREVVDAFSETRSLPALQGHPAQSSGTELQDQRLYYCRFFSDGG